MKEQIEILKRKFHEELLKAATVADMEVLSIKFLGKKGPVQDLMKLLRDVPSPERPLQGKWINDFKEDITVLIHEKQEKLLVKEDGARLKEEKIDITLPGRRRQSGNKHILTQMLDEIIDILIEMGFSVQYGPEIETDYYNFEALNFPPDHPARDMQDTFYVGPGVLLRTHTSNIQTRFMEGHTPPLRIIAPGKVYRNETVTARSHVFFHQVEGLYVDENVSFADLLATMDQFFSKLFYEGIETRYRPSYFPFVEPGMEVDIKCLVCKGAGCPLCKQTGWLEVAGAGMVHPEVLKNGGINPDKYSGFAWGLGIERMVMLKYGIRDIRMFTENDLKFLNQFT